MITVVGIGDVANNARILGGKFRSLLDGSDGNLENVSIEGDVGKKSRKNIIGIIDVIGSIVVS